MSARQRSSPTLPSDPIKGSLSGVGTNQVCRLRPHPLNGKIYGTAADAELEVSIAKYGVLNPIIINPNKEILSGTRRWMAAKKVGLKSVPVLHLFSRFDHITDIDLRSELFLIESNRQRIKTPEQRAREFTELKRIERQLAKQRRLAAQNNDRGRAVRANLPTQVEDGRARDIAAEKAGLKPRTAEKLEQIVQAADQGSQTARQQLDHINETGRGVDPAFRLLFRQMRQQRQAEGRTKAEELRKLLPATVELQASKEESRFNLFFWKQSEAQIRVIAKALTTEASIL